MKNPHPLITTFFAFVMLTACSKKDDPGTTAPPVATNGSGTLVLDGKSYTLTCLADRSGGTDGCGKIAVSLYTSGMPSLMITHFPEDAAGTYYLGDGNSQRGCNQVYAYVIDFAKQENFASKQITLTKTGAKSFTYSGTVYDPVSGIAHTVSGDGSYKN